MPEPKRIAVAGDWHGNTKWACSQVEQIAEKLGDESNKVIVHLGDFGFYPGSWGESYRSLLTGYLKQHEISLWAIDGNHENHWWLRAEAEKIKEEGLDIPGLLPNASLYPFTSHIAWLSRGNRWRWHNREWLALGGATSVDKHWRMKMSNGKAGVNWWPEEEITLEDEDRALKGGHADVMVTHECPAMVTHSFGSNFFDPIDLATADKHRQFLDHIVDRVKPKYLMHGHLHMAYERTVYRPYGDIRVTGFNCDGSENNWGILNVKTMEWEE